MSNSKYIQKLNYQEAEQLFAKISNDVRKNVINKYRENENNLRLYYEDKNILEKELENYFKKLNLYDDYTTNLFNKEEYFINLINSDSKENSQLYYLLIYDYFIIFLGKNINKNKNLKVKNENEKLIDIDFIKILYSMTNLRRNNIEKYLSGKKEEKSIVQKFGRAINWIESYSDEIILLKKIMIKLNGKIPELYIKIGELINKKTIHNKTSQNKYNYFSIINEVFVILLNSILKIINTNNEIYALSDQDLRDFITEIREIYKIISQLENDLNLYIQEAFTLKQILKLIDLFDTYDKITSKSVRKIIKYFEDEILFKNDTKKLCDNLNEFYNYLIEKIEDKSIIIKNNLNSYKILSYVLMMEFQKNDLNEFRKFILHIILENNNLIKNSSKIFRMIFENLINTNPEEIPNNLEKIKEENSSFLKIINNNKNIFLDEMIMNIFEGKIMIYFEYFESNNKILHESYEEHLKNKKDEKNKKEKEIVIGNSTQLFEKYISFLNNNISIINENSENIRKQNIHLYKLYIIVYIKIYLYKIFISIKNESNEKNEYNDIISIIKNIKNEKFRKVIKIYIIKLLFYFSNNNFEELKKIDFKYNIELQKDFPFFHKETDEILVKYYMLPLDQDDYNKYIEMLNKFTVIRNKNFDINIEMNNLIKEDDNIDIFLTMTINQIFFNLTLNNLFSKFDEYSKFSSFSKSLLDEKYKNNTELLKLLYLFYDSDTYLEKIYPKLNNQNSLEIILYGYRYCVQSLQNNKNEKFLYNSILSKECINVINQSLIPGIDELEDLHITTLETIITHLNTKNERHGCYVCSCGYYYDIDPCGFPTKNRTFDCPVCGLKIGWGPKKIKVGELTHGMVIRPGHYRIFKNENQKKSQMKVFDEVDENIPNILLEDYIKDIIEPIRKKSSFGYNSISKDYFENKSKKIRNMSYIGYRLLNYISYCYLFFSYYIGCISEENMKKCLIPNMTILQIIETNWNLLKESLEQKNIISIQIFMNMIFKKLSHLIQECKYLTKKEEREEFENQVEKLIEQSIEDFPNYYNNYIEENKNQLKLEDYYSIETIVSELIPPNEEIYSEEEYPLFKYFFLTKYKTKEDFISHMTEKEKYPLINQLLLDKSNFIKLKYLSKFNEFVNYMVHSYSFKITRDYSKNAILEKEDIFKTSEFSEKFKNFIQIWKEIKDEAIKYKCYPDLPIKELNANDKLAFFLNDNGELGYGLYLASACQNFIDWQNSFLLPIIEKNKKIGILHKYINNIIKKLPLNEAKFGQILLIEESFKKSKYRKLNDVIYSFSERNIFNNDGIINYSNYNSFVYDYDSIEEELGKIILPGLHLFENEENLNFMIFWSECYRGERSQILSKFFLKYPQNDLNEIENEIIINFIKKTNKRNKEMNLKNDYKNFFGSLQMIIYYLTEKIIIKREEKIINIINYIYFYFSISDECKNFFLNEGKHLTIDKIMNIYIYFEDLCYNDLIKNLQNEYKKQISSKLQNQILNKLNNEKDNFILYSKKDLAASVRRFISRYLIGETQTIDLKEDRDLVFELSREDLWEEKIRKNVIHFMN